MPTPTPTPEYFIRLTSAEEAKIISDGLSAIDNKTVVAQDLKRRIAAAARYFKNLNSTALLKIAADQRNAQRRRDGRG